MDIKSFSKKFDELLSKFKNVKEFPKFINN